MATNLQRFISSYDNMKTRHSKYSFARAYSEVRTNSIIINEGMFPQACTNSKPRSAWKEGYI